jgi:putative chitinase
MVTSEQLQKLHIDPQWVGPLNETFERFGILTPRQQAAFIGQCGHESGNFRVLEENLNYRAATLLKLRETAQEDRQPHLWQPHEQP